MTNPVTKSTGRSWIKEREERGGEKGERGGGAERRVREGMK